MRPLARACGVVALAAAAGGAGFLAGRARARAAEREGGRSEPAAESARPAARIAAELAELPLPRIESELLVEWRGVAVAMARTFERHGLPLDPSDEEAALTLLRRAGDPEALAALLDARAAVEHAAQHPTARDAFTRLARALDPDPTRDAIRAPLLANDATAVRMIAADLDAARLPLRTATLLGAALLRGGDVEDALEAWRAVSVGHPDDLALRLLLGWRLLATDPPRSAEARRHLEAARALRPGSAAVRARLEAAGG